MNGQFRQFEVTTNAKIQNLVLLGEYAEGYGGLAYLDVSSAKVVLVPNVVEIIKKAEPLNLSIDAEYKVINGKWTQTQETQPQAQQEAEQKAETKTELGATNF